MQYPIPIFRLVMLTGFDSTAMGTFVSDRTDIRCVSCTGALHNQVSVWYLLPLNKAWNVRIDPCNSRIRSNRFKNKCLMLGSSPTVSSWSSHAVCTIVFCFLRNISLQDRANVFWQDSFFAWAKDLEWRTIAWIVVSLNWILCFHVAALCLVLASNWLLWNWVPESCSKPQMERRCDRRQAQKANCTRSLRKRHTHMDGMDLFLKSFRKENGLISLLSVSGVSGAGSFRCWRPQHSRARLVRHRSSCRWDRKRRASGYSRFGWSMLLC